MTIDLSTLQAERYILWAGLERAGLVGLATTLFQCGLGSDRSIPLAAVDDRGMIQVNLERAAELPPAQIRWALLHEAIHAALGHPRRFGRLEGRAKHLLREVARAAAEGQGPVGVGGMSPATAALWVQAWTEALAAQGQTWTGWEARTLQRFMQGLQIAGDLLVHAWMEMIAQFVRPGLLAPPERIFRPAPEEIPHLLRAVLEELAEELLGAAIAALPGSGHEDRDGEPSIRSIRDLVEALRNGASLPSADVPGLVGASGGQEAKGEVPLEGGPGEGGAGILPGWAREVLGQAYRHGLVPWGLAEQLAPGTTGVRSLEVELEVFLQEVRGSEPRPCWRRLSRRTAELEVRLPARESGHGVLIAAIRDTSGSMDRGTLERITAVIMAAEGIAGILALDADAWVQGGVLWIPRGTIDLPLEAEEILHHQIPGLKVVDRKELLEEWLATARGRGGTDFRPVVALVNTLRLAGFPLGGVIYFTDGKGEFPCPEEEPDLPFQWVVPQRISVPFGTVIERPDLFQGRKSNLSGGYGGSQ